MEAGYNEKLLKKRLEFRKKKWQAGFLKLSKKSLAITLISLTILIPLISLPLFFPKSAEAVWYDDNWAYRQRIPIDTHTAAETNVYNEMTVDTATLTTDKLQADCDDLRFTKQNGELLPYYIVSGCDSASTTIRVGFDTMPIAPFNIYMYYGNPNAATGSTLLGHSACGNGCAEGTAATEEKAQSPIAYWKLDEGQGTTTTDSTSNNLDGTLTSVISNGGPVNINNASDFGVMTGAIKQVVRASSGTLYAFVFDSPDCEVWKSTDGTTWSEVDAADSPTCTFALGIAIDSSNKLHLLYANSGSANYISMTSDDYGTEATIYSNATISHGDIAIDSSDIPHVAISSDDGADDPRNYTISYSNRIGGSWKSAVTVETQGGSQLYPAAIVISEDNIPEIAYSNSNVDDLTAALGNVNDAASFTLVDVDAAISNGNEYASIAVDSSGNTWIAYVDENGATDYVTLVKHNDADAWATWQTPVTNSNAGDEPSIVVNGTSVYVFYDDDAFDVKYDLYTGSWLGETNLQTGTFQDVKAKWSFLNNNKGTSQIDYLYSDATDVFWASLSLSSTSSPNWQTEDFCISGKCLYFDGANNENVSIADNAKLDFGATDNFTVSAWVKRNGASSAINYIQSKADTTTGGYKLWMDADGDLCFGIDDDTSWGPDISACSTNANFDDDKWHYVTGVRDQTGTDKVYVYVDGIDKSGGGTSDTTSATLANGNIFYTGVDRDGTSNEWLGYIDEAKVYPYARSAAQILADFNSRSNNEGVDARFGVDPNNSYKALNDGLIGYWKMDETSWNGTAGEVIDSSGNAYHGTALTPSGPSTTSLAKFGNAGDFDGSNDYADLPANSGLLRNVSAATVSMWVYPDAPAGADHAIFSIGTGVSTTRQMVVFESDSQVRCDARVADADSSVQTTTSTTISSSKWTHITCVYIYGKNSVSIYFNGVKQPLVSEPTFSQATTSDTNALDGSFGTTRSHTFPYGGSLDEVRVYHRALSDLDVAQLYNFAPGPVGYWKFDEGSGTSAVDSSGLENNGTLTNSPTYAPGKFGKGLNFAGSDAHVLRADDADFDFADDADMSFMAWFKHGAQTSGTEVILSKFNEAGYKISMETDGDIQCGLDYDSTWTPTDSAISTAATYDDNLWHHAACVKSGASSLSLYIDGVLIAQDTSLTATNTLTNSDPLYIGIDADGTSNDWIGQIDEAKIYNFARTSKQVIQDINAGHPAPGSPVGSAVGYWKLDEGTDNKCSGGTNDVCNSGSQGSTLDGTKTNATWTNSGKFGKAVSYDGTGDDVTITDPANGSLDPSGAFTVSAWVRYSSRDGSDTILSKTNADNTGYFLGQLNSGCQCFRFAYNSDAIQGTTANADNTWFHVVGVYDQSTARLYVNGKLDATDTSVPASITANAASFIIGAGTAPPNTYGGVHQGQIDEVKFYNLALTAAQVQVEYNRGSSQILGALSDDASYEKNAAAQEYCVPGDTSTVCDGTDTPVGRWDFEEGSGTSAFDTSINGNLGTITAGAGSYKPGKIGKAYDFDTADTVVNAGTGSTLDNLPASGMTLEAWIYPESAGENSLGFILAKNAGTSPSAGWILRLNSTTSLTFEVDGSTDLVRTTNTSLITQNAWNHVAVTWDGVITTAASADIYINGKEATYATSTNGASRVDDNASTFYIGNDSTSARTFDGKIDNVRAFNYARTAAQIAWDYNRGKPFLHFKIDECQGTTLNDSSGNGNSGTITIGASGNTVAGTCSAPTDGTGAWYDGVTGKRNYSLDLDGTDDYVTESALSQTITDTAFSISTWVNLDSLASAIVWEDEASAPSLQTNGSDKLQFWMNDANTIQTTVLSTGQWYHIVATFDGTDQKLYQDGKLIGTNTSVSGDTIDALDIGSRGGGGLYLNGRIDDFKMFNYGLTAVQVQALYNDGAARFGPTTGAP